LSKILTPIFNCPPPQAAGRNRLKTNRLAGKKFPPLKPLHFLPARRKKFLARVSIFILALAAPSRTQAMVKNSHFKFYQNLLLLKYGLLK
jgi:hypothetical protein